MSDAKWKCPHGLTDGPAVVPHGGPIDYQTGDGYFLCGDQGARCHACREDRADARAVLAVRDMSHVDVLDELRDIRRDQQALRSEGEEGGGDE